MNMILVFMGCQCNVYVIPKSISRKDLGCKRKLLGVSIRAYTCKNVHTYNINSIYNTDTSEIRTNTYNIRALFQEPVPNHHFHLALICTYMYQEPVPNHHFYLAWICTYMQYMNVFMPDIRTENLNTYSVVVCMYLHVYCCFHLRLLDQLPASLYMHICVCIFARYTYCEFEYLRSTYMHVMNVYACICLYIAASTSDHWTNCLQVSICMYMYVYGGICMYMQDM